MVVELAIPIVGRAPIRAFIEGTLEETPSPSTVATPPYQNSMVSPPDWIISITIRTAPFSFRFSHEILLLFDLNANKKLCLVFEIFDSRWIYKAMRDQDGWTDKFAIYQTYFSILSIFFESNKLRHFQRRVLAQKSW